VEDVSVADLVEKHDTPLFVYSRSAIRDQYVRLVSALEELDPLICYSVKANCNGSVIKTLADEGCGMDIVSGGELYRALRAGADHSKIVFAGVGKTRDEIEYALKEQILFFTVESESEVRRISECADKLGLTGRVAFRINPGVDPQTHKYISTGKAENKFGMDRERTTRAYETAAGLSSIEIVGLHMHIGSQILSVSPFVEAIDAVADFCRELKERYSSFRYFDIGGGLGIQYKPDQEPLAPEVFAEAVVPKLKDLGVSILMEPGRYLLGNAGILVTRVQYVKDNPFKKFIIVDTGMQDLIRPSLYDAYHDVVPVVQGTETVHGDLVGPICESGDFIAKDRDLPSVEEGDLLAVKSAGAYAFAMASHYNSRGRPAEIMVDGDSATVIRERETWQDMVRGEKMG